MAHNIHFLERIERLNLRQADRALALYRDPQAVAFLLLRLDLPDAAERVAVAIGPGDEPPHVVLSRNGQFVTCLGPGMATRDVYTVTFDRMERVLGQFEALRDALDGQITLGGALGKLRNLFHKSDAISREEFSGLLALRPVLGGELMRLEIDTWAELDAFRTAWRPDPRLKGSREESHALSAYWRALWATGHLSTLLVADVPDLERIWARSAAEIGPSGPYHPCITLTWSLTRSGVMGLTLRGYFHAARLGRTFLQLARTMADQVETEKRLLHTIGGLHAVALRHSRLRDEALRLVDRARRHIAEKRTTASGGFGAYYSWLEAMADRFRVATIEPELIRKAVLSDFKSQIAEGFAGLPGAPEGEAPDDVALALAPLLLHLYQKDAAEFVEYLTLCLPAIARADITHLYLPEAYLRHVVSPTNKVDVDIVRTHLEHVLSKAAQPRTPVRVEKKPGRNEPCTCGSGKKYKACCGR